MSTPDTTNQALGILIRDRRTRANMTRTELAEKVGINRTSMSKIEAGEIRPRRDKLPDIAEALGNVTEAALEIAFALSRPVQLHCSRLAVGASGSVGAATRFRLAIQFLQLAHPDEAVRWTQRDAHAVLRAMDEAAAEELAPTIRTPVPS